MNKTIINGQDFYKFMKSGAVEVTNKKDDLNRINVFPVQDGDTGTNLVMTMNSIVDETELSNDFDIVIKSMSDIAFESARGNSGIIFASFINGFSNACGHLKTLSMEQFGVGAKVAAAEAYASVSVPVEGTMLTVIRAWASYISENHKKHLHFRDLFEAAYQKALVVLEETPEMLEVLKRNKVVDAGAKGFVIFLEGVNKFLSDIVHGVEVQKPMEAMAYDEADRLDFNHRYCTEVLLQGGTDDKAKIEKLLYSLGDSLIISGNERLTKVHLHTNIPQNVTRLLAAEGYKITKSKVDDMLLQFEVQKNQKSRIAILTDSIADIHPDLVFSEQIHQLSLGLIADESIYLDKITVNEETISEILNNSKVYPTSTQLDSKQLKARMEWLVSHYDAVIAISVSKALSGTYAVYDKIITSYREQGYPAFLIDSKLNTSGQGMLVLKAAEMANSGKCAEEIISAIESEIPRTDIYVSLDTFKYAVKSGRVPNKIGKILMALGAKPIMTLDRNGKGGAFGLAFSQKSIDKRIMKVVKSIAKEYGVDRYSVVHAGGLERAKQYADAFEKILGMPPVYITPISAITTIHSGIGSVAISLVRRAK